MAEVKRLAKLKCPQCSGEMEVFSREDHSFWPEGILELIMSCKCGYKGFDIIPLVVNPPNRLELRVKTENDLKTRVIKSSRAFIRIPELGVEIKPGPASQGYISNIEGVLDRIESVLKDMVKWKKPNSKKMLERIQGIRRSFSEPFTLIIEDPTGCSLIISEETKKTLLK